MIKPPSLAPFAFGLSLLSLSALLAFASGAYAQNTSGTWTNTNTTGADWTNTANWSGGSYAGAIGTTTTTNTATFSSAVATPYSPILISTNINLRGITFTSAAGNYTIGTTTGSSLFMSASSTILITNNISASNTVITINAPLVMYGSLTINNQASNGFSRFVIGGNISSGSASGTNTLILQSISANSLNTNVITGLISDGTIGGRVAVTGSGSGGTWYLLNNSNSFSGTLSINGGTVFVTSIRDRGINSAAGSGTTINIGSTTSGGALQYIGTGDTNNRIINLAGTTGGATIVASGTGLLRFTTNFTANGIGSKALILSGTNAGEISGSIVDNSTTGSTVTTVAATTTNTLSLASVDGLTNGAIITGTNIPTGASITGISNRVVTLNTNVSFISGASITNAGLVNITSLTKQGTGTWTLLGSNSYSGTTTVSAGTLLLGNSNALGANSGSLAVTGGFLNLNGFSITKTSVTGNAAGVITNSSTIRATLTINNAGSVTTASTLAGNLALLKSGTGMLTLTGTNTYRGGTTINAGGLSISNNSAFGTGTVTVAGSSTITALTNLTVTNNYIINSGAIAIFSTTNLWTNSGSITGNGALNKRGSGTLTLSGSNNYTGDTIVSEGQLILGNRFALSGSTFAGGAGSLSFGSLTRFTFGGLASSTNLALINTTNGDVSLTVGVNNANTTNSGSITGSGALTKTGSGTLTLSGSNSYSGGTILDQGGLSISNNDAFGTGIVTVNSNSTITTITALTNLTVANDYWLEAGATATFSTTNLWTNLGSITGYGGLTKTGSGTLILSASNSYEGGTILNQGGLSISNNSAFGTGTVTVATNSAITGLANLTVINDYVINSGAIATFSTTNLWINSGVMSGAGALTKTGTGTLTLTGVNIYRGGTTLNQGGVFIGNNSAFGTGIVTVASNSTITGLTNLTVTNNYIINPGATATLSTTNLWTNSGSISGAGGINKAGAGTLILSSSNSYLGASTITAGSLIATNANSLGASSSPITVSGGVLNLGGNSFNRMGLITFSSGTVTNGTLTNNTTNFAGQSGTIAAILAGSAGLNKTGTGVLTLTGTNTYTGLTTISNGVLSIFNSNTLAGWGSTNYAVASGGALAFGGGFTDDEITNAVYNSGKFSNGASFGFDTASGTNRIYSQVISDTANETLGLAKVGAGTLTLTGSNSYSAPTIIYAGTLQIGDSNALGTGALVLNGGALTSSSSDPWTIPNNFSLSNSAILGSTNTNNGTLTFTGTGNLGASGLRTLTINNAVIFDGTLTNTAGFIKSGIGTLTLSGSNSYSGGTILNQGGLSISNNAAFGTGVVTVASNSTITALTDLTVANNYVINSNSTATFSTTNLWTNSGSITGGGSLTKTGSGTLTLSSDANDYSGGTTVSAGTLIVSNEYSIGVSDSPITVTNNGTLDLGGEIFTRTGLITFAGGTVTNGTLRNNTSTNFDGQSGTVAAKLDGSAGLTKTGSGTLTLSGINTFAGGTLVTEGTLMATNSTQAFGRNGVTNNGGAIDLGSQTFTNTFDLESGTITNGTISNNANFTLLDNGIVAATLAGSGTFIKAGSGTLTLLGSNSYAGGTLVTNGSIVAANENALSTNTVSVQGNGLLNLGSNTFTNTFAITDGTITNGTISNNANFTRFSNGAIGAVIAGSGTLIKQGAGTLTLAASNSYSGGTVITNGTLTVGNDFALGAASNNLNIPSGTLGNIGFRITVQALTIGNGTITGSGTITAISYTATNSGSALIENSLAGNGGLIKEDLNGTLTLSGSNTYSGGTTIRTGTINANNNSALGTGGLTMTNGAAGLALTNSNTILRLGNGINISNATTITLGPVSRITNTGTLTISGGDNFINLTTNWSWSIPAGTSVTYPLLQGTNTAIRTNNDSIFLNIPGIGVSLSYGATTNVGRVGVVGGTNFTFTNSVYRTNRTSIPSGLVLMVDVPGMPIEAFPATNNANIPAAAFDGGVKAISVSPNGISSSLNGNGQVVVWALSTTVTNVPSDLTSGVTAISAGYTHMMALKNGRVTTWGNIATPTPARAQSGVVAISAGTDCLAIRQDGTVVGWGRKYLSTDPFGAYRVISMLTNAVGISDGLNQGLALLADGTVVGFGNAFGTARDAYTEVRSLGLTNIAAVSEGNNFAMALKKDGSVVAWGNSSMTNVPTNAMSGVASISAGWNYAVALKTDGSVVAWGNVPATLSTNSIQATAVEAGYDSLLIGRKNAAGRSLDDCQTSGGLQNNPFINNGGNNGARVLPIPRATPPSRLMPGQTTSAPQPGAVVPPPGRVPPPSR